jgi:pimeloyl-ACP methyl ester carboxylesterase
VPDSTPASEPTAPPPSTSAPSVTATPTTQVAPSGDAFYVPPDPLPGSAAGDLIWAAPIEPAPQGTRAWRVLYRSESVAGDPIAVSGTVVAPATPSATPRPVLDWAHGTTGLGDQCAPSKTFGATSLESLLASAAAGMGYTYVATDYEGLGTPGVHPYLVGLSEGRGVLDIARAAAQLDGAGVDSSSPIAILGHSQGGHAALMAAELAPTYAPELRVVGVAAGAPPGDVALIERGTATAGASLSNGFGLMMDAGFAAAYPDLPADALVSDDGLALLGEVATACTTEALRIAADAGDVQRDGTTDPRWAAVFDANSAGHVAPQVPVLIVHGAADTTVPPALSAVVAARYCDLGVTLQRTLYEGADHVSVMIQGFPEIQAWITARVAGEPAPDNC